MSADNKAKAVEAKNRGNTFFAAGKHTEAIAAFTQAIELDSTEHGACLHGLFRLSDSTSVDAILALFVENFCVVPTH
jgi:tetratricopeptide (TPR) repeat protein